MLEFKLVQGSRLRNAVGPLRHIRGEATVFCNSETLYLQASDIDRTIVALLRFRSGFFNRYVVNRKAMAGVEVLALGIILETTDDKDSIAVRANCHSNVIDFTFEDVETHKTRNMSTDIIGIPRDHIEFDDSSYEYEVVVGVPSTEFRRIFASLRNSGPGAFVYVTASRVRFYTVGQEIVLTKEHGECIIGGVKEEDEQKTLLGILHRKIKPILEASELCGTVWFLQSARRTNSPFPPPTMINCPIGLMANLNFHFVRE
ncbi:hypothetical protein RHSIM_Rhsim01G0113500 [Rhododendron simsii]|uniref:Proliferating cell nuclear antigen PCNA N-terminal domain-containing protein n=1 Tax=Rhododendron simsii TaxID=118357 RepID=A0A834M217_RHOSS|nr:hypothetical protein RHSIM_Rhsim01G0113500 [Rhododendron simsii]